MGSTIGLNIAPFFFSRGLLSITNLVTLRSPTTVVVDDNGVCPVVAFWLRCRLQLHCMSDSRSRISPLRVTRYSSLCCVSLSDSDSALTWSYLKYQWTPKIWSSIMTVAVLPTTHGKKISDLQNLAVLSESTWTRRPVKVQYNRPGINHWTVRPLLKCRFWIFEIAPSDETFSKINDPNGF